MDSNYEQRLNNAIEAVEAGELTQAEASHRWSVHKSTLCRRLQGRLSRIEANEPNQRLSKVQEEFLADWICTEELSGRAPTKRMVNEFAGLIIAGGSDSRPLGINWIDGFLSRNPRVRTKIGRFLEASRAKEATKQSAEAFYDSLRGIISAFHIPSDRITNIDETGLQEGESSAGKVLGSVVSRYTDVKKSEATSWVTIIEAITATGSRLTPIIIFTGESLQGQWFPDLISPWKYDHSSTGWSNSKIALRWLQEVYLPETKPARQTLKRLLILDEHTTHVTVKFMYKAYSNNVLLLYLPPHSSHFTQPLDVGVFSALKTYYRRATRGWASYDTSVPVQKQRFLTAYASASADAFSSQNIHSAFRKTGIWPVKSPEAPLSERILETDLGPARPTTPELTVDLDNEGKIWWTPRDSRELKQQSRRLESKIGTCQRDFRTLLNKASKKIDKNSTEIAGLKAENASLRLEIESLKPQPRIPIKRSNQEAFYRIDEIMRAQATAQERRPAMVAEKKRKLAQEKNAAAAKLLEQLEEQET